MSRVKGSDSVYDKKESIEEVYEHIRFLSYLEWLYSSAKEIEALANIRLEKRDIWWSLTDEERATLEVREGLSAGDFE